jgi:uncharacterized protein (DUF2062 family)
MKPIQWRRTKLGKYLRHLPRRKHIKGTLVHRLFGDRLFESELWHPTRQRFASGMALGAFFALMPPLPFQMVGAGIIAFITRVNVPAALAGTWISNPFTTPFIVYLQYRLGCLMMGREPIHIAEGQLLSSLASAPLPYMLGILPSATVLALVSYPLTLIFWDLIHSRLEAARKRKAQRALHDALPKKLLESAEPDGH